MSLAGTADSRLYSFTTNAQGQYEVAPQTFLRPKLGVNYQHKSTQSTNLSGPVFGQQIRVDIDSQRSDSLTADASLELNRVWRDDKGRLFVPFAEAGVRYVRLWPDAPGESVSRPQDVDWQGIIRLGGRALLGPYTQVELNASYQSIGVSNLDIWEAGIFLSHAF